MLEKEWMAGEGVRGEDEEHWGVRGVGGNLLYRGEEDRKGEGGSKVWSGEGK